MHFPAPSRPLVDFAQFLREHGFTVAPEQIVTFLSAVALLGPRNMESIRRAAHATLAPPPDRRGEFDALFRAYFHEEADALAIAKSLPEDDAPASEGGGHEPQAAERAERVGRGRDGDRASVGAHISAGKTKRPRAIACAGRLRRLRRVRRTFRMSPAKRGRIDLRRSLRSIVPNDGDVIRLARAESCRGSQRHVLVLIDISGSMKRHTADYLRFAHALTQAARQSRPSPSARG